MSHWSDVTRNLIMQNSGPVRHQGGDLGRTAWFYVVGSDGVKTIEPAVGFYLNPPPNSRCSWSTDHGRLKPNHIIISDDGSNDGMPPRELVNWNDNTIQNKAEQYRNQYWEDLKALVRPNTFEDLYELFDSATLWHNGAYNLCKLVNALVTLAHDQFPYVMRDWKDCIEKVVYEVFRPVAGSSRSVGQNNNMQVLHNQHVLTDWDHSVDPLILLQHTSFPIDFLASMNVQQHGILREILICEHIRVTGTRSPFPQYYKYPRPGFHTAPTHAPEFVDNQLHCALVNNSASQTQPGNAVTQVVPVNLASQKLQSSMPLVVVGTNDRNGQLKTQPRGLPTLSKDQVTSVSVSQPPVLSSPSSSPPPSITEESSSINTGEVIHKGIAQEATPSVSCPMEGKPNSLEAPDSHVTTQGAVPITDANATGRQTAVPKIKTKEATPPPDSPIRDRKDSNGSADELFFPNAQSDKLHVGRQRSVASAPDHETDTMLTVAEKNSLPVSETPPPMQAHSNQQFHTTYQSSGASIAKNPTSQGSLRFPVPGRNQGRPQSGPTGYQIKPAPQHCRHMGYSSGPANCLLRGPALFNLSPPNMPPNLNGPFTPSPSSMNAGPGVFNPHCAPPPSTSVAMPMGPPMALPMAVQTGPPMGPPFQHQMPPNMNPQLVPNGPLTNTNSPFMNRQGQYPPGYQTCGPSHQPRNYISHGEHGDNGYSNKGYRNSNSNSGSKNQYNGKRRSSFTFNGSRNNTIHSVPGAANFVPRRPGVGFQGRRLSNAGRPDQNRGRTVFFNCKNDIELKGSDLFTSHFVECSCVRCEESSRSVFVRLRPQANKSDEDIQNALLRHFAQFSPVAAKIRRAPGKMTCLVHIESWYPLFSKHYVPQKPHETQVRYQTHSLFEHNRRDSNPFRNQQPAGPLTIQDGYNVPGSLPYNFPPLNVITYQQVQPHNQPRVLYDPNAPQRRDSKLQNAQPNISKSDQKIHAKLGCSQEVRKSRSLPKGPWRQPQPKPSSEQSLADGEKDGADALKGAPYAPPVEKAKVSSLTDEVSATLGANPPDPSRGGSSEMSSKPQDTSQVGNPSKERHRRDKSGKNKLPKDQSKAERINTNDCKIAGKNGDSGAASSRVVAPDTPRPRQRGKTLADDLQTGEESVSNSSRDTLDTTTTVHRERTPVDELEAIDEDDQESMPSSKTMTPETVKSLEYTIATQHKQSPVKNNAARQEQADHSQVSFGPDSASGTVRVDTLKNVTVTSGYSMTTNQLSSAVEDVGYCTETVIRHKPGRHAIPRSWADDEADDEAHAGAPSPIGGIHNGSALLNRISSIDSHVNRCRLQVIASIPVEEIVEAVMTGDVGTATADVSLANKANTLSAACGSTEANTNDEGPASFNPGSVVATQQHSKSSRGRKHKNKSKKKKKKEQGKASQLPSRSQTPNKLQSRGPSPVSERPLSPAALSNTSSRGPLTYMQGNDEALSEGALLPKKVNNKQAKDKRKRKLPVAEVFDGLAVSGDLQDDRKQAPSVDPSLQKTEASRNVSAKKSVPLLVGTARDPQAPPDACSGKSSRFKFRSDTVGGSLRMPKNRSPEKGSQKNKPQSTMKDQASSLNAELTLLSVFEPPAKDMDVHVDASSTQKLTIGTSKKPTPPETSLEKPDLQRSTTKTSKNNDPRVALPKVALPLPQVAGLTKTSGDCASVAKPPASHSLKLNNKDDNDLLGIGKEQTIGGISFQDKNVKSPQKPRASYEKHDVLRETPSPRSSSEKESRTDTTAKSQLNAAVKSFDPSASCNSLASLTKPRLNPNAASFSLQPSPSHSVISILAPVNGRKGRDATAVSKEENEKAAAAQHQMALAGRHSVQEGHSRGTPLPGHTTGIDKRFVTPAEQILDSKRVVQPPPPSKETKRTGPMLERSRASDRGAGLRVISRQNIAGGIVSDESIQGVANADTAERSKGIKAAPRTTARVTADVGTRPRSNSPKTVPESPSHPKLTALNTELFPTLEQAAALGTIKKRRTASIIKAESPTTITVGPVSGTVVGRNIIGPSQTSGPTQTQQAKIKQIDAPVSPAPVVAKTPQPIVVQKHTHTQRDEPKQPGDKDSWQTVVPKQKNNVGSIKGHTGRASKCGSLRNARGARGGRDRHDGATEERKGG
ncbi:hypothetical protein N0V82_006966 [Gnomoniopsis sp. IMI 355080]|nr:hypothetical protein N0V82_006966 [Gnomoniopsis sp. IMI 355080]